MSMNPHDRMLLRDALEAARPQIQASLMRALKLLPTAKVAVIVEHLPASEPRVAVVERDKSAIVIAMHGGLSPESKAELLLSICSAGPYAVPAVVFTRCDDRLTSGVVWLPDVPATSGRR